MAEATTVVAAVVAAVVVKEGYPTTPPDITPISFPSDLTKFSSSVPKRNDSGSV